MTRVEEVGGMVGLAPGRRGREGSHSVCGQEESLARTLVRGSGGGAVGNEGLWSEPPSAGSVVADRAHRPLAEQQEVKAKGLNALDSGSALREGP